MLLFIVGFVLLLRMTLMAFPKYGWIARPWYVRLAMGCFAATLLVRAWFVLAYNPFRMWSQDLSLLSLVVWQTIELHYQVKRAHQLHRAEQMLNGPDKVVAIYNTIGKQA